MIRTALVILKHIIELYKCILNIEVSDSCPSTTLFMHVTRIENTLIIYGSHNFKQRLQFARGYRRPQYSVYNYFVLVIYTRAFYLHDEYSASVRNYTSCWFLSHHLI